MGERTAALRPQPPPWAARRPPGGEGVRGGLVSSRTFCLSLGLSISFTESLPFPCLALALCLSPSLCLSLCPSLVLCVPLFLLFWLPVFLSSPCPHVSLSLPKTLLLCLYPPWSL